MEKIHFLGRIPRNVTLACSGGPDSMAALSFLLHGRKNVTVAYFDHGTRHGSEALSFLKDYCSDNSLPLVVGDISSEKKPKDKSLEEWWRDERYKFFFSFPGKKITCHHLNDVAEGWIFSSLNGRWHIARKIMG